MSNDGILFKRLGSINRRTKTPLFATIISGLLSGLMALVFDLNQLIDMMSIGTLMAYTIVAVCVLVLRYKVEGNTPESVEGSPSRMLTQIFNLRSSNVMTKRSYKVAVGGILLCSICAIVFCVILLCIRLEEMSMGWIIGLGVIGLLGLASVIAISRQPTIECPLSFHVPLVPWIPCLSVLTNTYLMFQLDSHTWMRFIIWGAVGNYEYSIIFVSDLILIGWY